MQDLILSDLLSYIKLSPGDRLGVAVSGGADSVALLHLLHGALPGRGVALVALHLNHGLRGPDSDSDEAFVHELATSLALDFHSERAVLNADGANLEAEARQARLDFFRRKAQELSLAAVATGHTLDDQAETVLFRLLRGTGVQGLSAILPWTREGLVRPMLRVRREELRAWLRERNLPWREDLSNADPRFSRNRIRAEVLPALVRDWNPNLAEALTRLARQAREESEAWEATCSLLLRNLSRSTPAGEILDLRPLQDAPRALLRRLIRLAVTRLPGAPAPDAESLERAADLCLLRSGGAVQGSGFYLSRSFHLLLIAAGKPAAGPLPVVVAKPGQYRLAGQSVDVVETIGESNLYNVGSDLLDAGRVHFPLVLRGWHWGDRYRPAGGAGEEKIKELFQRSQVPSWERVGWPILASGERIVWAARFGPAHWAAAGRESGRQLRVRLNVSD